MRTLQVRNYMKNGKSVSALFWTTQDAQAFEAATGLKPYATGVTNI